MDKSYKLVKTETIDIDIDIDYYANNAIDGIANELCDEFDINDNDVESILPEVMKDITKKLIEKYLDKE